jgi:DNA-directed RNA polymerase subunit RPC12/RpoP
MRINDYLCATCGKTLASEGRRIKTIDILCVDCNTRVFEETNSKLLADADEVLKRIDAYLEDT